MISLICIILGYENDNHVDEATLGVLMSLAPMSINLFPIYDGCNLLARNINEHLDEFPIISMFRYPSYLFYLFVHQNDEYFKGLNLKMTSDRGNELPMFKWNEYS